MNDSPGQETVLSTSSKYSEKTVDPLKELPANVIESVLLDKTTVDCLPYLSDKTTPTW